MRTPALLRLALLAAPLLMPIGLVTGQTSRVSQDSDTGKPRGWLVGGSVGLPVLDGGTSPDLFTVAVHGTQLRPGRLGADFAVGTMPRAFAEGVAIGFGRAGVALPFQVSRGVLILPSAGVTVAGAASGDGGGSTTGLNAGLAAVIFGTGSIGLRTGVTWHRFGDAGASVSLWELGLVHVPRPG
jgi:hypothetical protein